MNKNYKDDCLISTTKKCDDSSEAERIARKRKSVIFLDRDNHSNSERLKKMPYADKSKAELDDRISSKLLPTSSKDDMKAKKLANKSDSIPVFRKPVNDSDDNDDIGHEDVEILHAHQIRQTSVRQSNWRIKKESEESTTNPQSSQTSCSKSSRPISPENTKGLTLQNRENEFLTDQQMNELGAKILKAEITGNDKMINELRKKLERARQFRTSSERHHNLNSIETKCIDNENEILLTSMDSKGMNWPVAKVLSGTSSRLYKSSPKISKTEAHTEGERMRYYSNDDKYNIKQMVSVYESLPLKSVKGK